MRLRTLDLEPPRVYTRLPRTLFSWHWVLSTQRYFEAGESLWGNHMMPGRPIHPNHIDRTYTMCGRRVTPLCLALGKWEPAKSDRYFCQECRARRQEGDGRPPIWQLLDENLPNFESWPDDRLLDLSYGVRDHG